MDKILNNNAFISGLVSFSVFIFSTLITSKLKARSNRLSTLSSIIISAENKDTINSEDFNHVKLLKRQSNLTKRWYDDLISAMKSYNEKRDQIEYSITKELTEIYFGNRLKNYTVPSITDDGDGDLSQEEHTFKDNIYNVFQLAPDEIDAVYDITNSIITGSKAKKSNKGIFFESIHGRTSDSFEFVYVEQIAMDIYKEELESQDDPPGSREHALKSDLPAPYRTFFKNRDVLIKQCNKNPFFYSFLNLFKNLFKNLLSRSKFV